MLENNEQDKPFNIRMKVWVRGRKPFVAKLPINRPPTCDAELEQIAKEVTDGLDSVSFTVGKIKLRSVKKVDIQMIEIF